MLRRPRAREPSSLYNLAFGKMIHAAKTGRKKLEIEKIPPGIANKVWDDNEIRDIVTAGIQPRLLPWFSAKVVKPPTSFTVRIETFINKQVQAPEPYDPTQYAIWNYDNTCTTTMSFENKPDTTWVKTYSYEGDEDETDSENEGSEISWSSEEEQDEDKGEKKQKTPRNEQFAKEYKSLSESIERFCKLFRTEIHELEIVWSNVKSDMFPGLKLWSSMKKARHVIIEKCEDSEFLIELLSDRHARGLPTTTTNIIFNNPIQSSLDPFYNLNIRCAKLNIKNHTHSDFMELVEHLLPTADFLDFRIPGSLGQHVEQFKDRFMLQSLNPSYLMELASPEETELEKWLTGYSLRPDGSAMAFFFVGGHYKGTFTRMVARHYVHKSTLPDIYEQVGSQWVERMR
ncbi:hypothetical protein CAEBREN_02538 [Caenorhabditis brenneri]|uniref:Uncharacterized protein n=1 Tax=Caenorhabditis brenneri TaxID=135651 RepID=G0MAA4_CAEBE|nr:hypothetical protein CAEBREN_02538 [Caenorhabditis brenneri]